MIVMYYNLQGINYPIDSIHYLKWSIAPSPTTVWYYRNRLVEIFLDDII